MRKVAVIPGDGIGPEVMASAMDVLVAAGAPLEFTELKAGLSSHKAGSGYIPQETIDISKSSDAVLMGAVTTNMEDPDYISPILTLRRELDLFANLRRARSIGPDTIDITVIRENTEGLYVQRERKIEDGYSAEKPVTRFASKRIIETALRYALDNDLTKLTAVHKANVLRKSDGLFLDIFNQIVSDANIQTDDMHVDAAAMRMVGDPGSLPCIVTLNLYGDILSDLSASLIGGLGLLPSANIGTDHALFEPAHGSAPDMAGTGKANPIAMILSACLMLEHLGLQDVSRNIRNAITDTVASGISTPDLGGTQDTKGFTEALISKLP